MHILSQFRNIHTCFSAWHVIFSWADTSPINCGNDGFALSQVGNFSAQIILISNLNVEKTPLILASVVLCQKKEDAGKAPKSSGELRREIQIQPLMVKVTSGQDMSTIGQRRLVLNQFYVIFKGINLMRVMARGLGSFLHDNWCTVHVYILSFTIS